MRQPAYVIFSLAFPIMIYLFFGVPHALEYPAQAAIMMGSYAAYAVVGVVLFQFGIGVAQDRENPWHRFLRTLPLKGSVLFAARLVTAVLFAAMVAGAVVAVAVLTTDVGLSGWEWVRFCMALLLGALPFGTLGFMIGYWVSPRASVPLANLIYLPMAYAGGLWAPLESLPPAVAQVAPFLPTYRYGQLVWRAVMGQPWRAEDWIILLLCALLFGALALIGHRRDEGRQYA